MTEVLAAILGAILAGGVQFIVARCDLAKTTESILAAISAEVGTCCEFIRMQQYSEQFAECERLANNCQVSRLPPIDAKQNYFVIFESLAPDIGRIGAENAAKVVRFYTLLKIAIDTARPDSIFDGTAQNARFMLALTNELPSLGDEIAQMPRHRVKLKRFA